MYNMYYRLNEDKTVTKLENMKEYIEYMSKANDRRIGADTINDTYVSTVFLSIDHNFYGSTPLLFETMAFSDNPDYNDYQVRYSTWEEAVKGHEEAVEKVKKGIPLIERKPLTIKLNIDEETSDR